jgi:hypothetical protein
MDFLEEFRHSRIKGIAVSVEVDIALFYSVASVIVMSLISIEIPDGGDGFCGKEVFEEEKLSKISNITGVAVLQRSGL